MSDSDELDDMCNKKLQEIYEYFGDIISNTSYGYKSCREYIVVLEIRGVTNESRGTYKTIDKNYAKFRTSLAKVKLIFHKFDLTFVDSIRNNIYSKNITYTVGQFVSPDLFDDNLNSVCAGGIHYFKTIESAFYYGLMFENIGGDLYKKIDYGVIKFWNDDGILCTKISIVNGKFNKNMKIFNDDNSLYANINLEIDYEAFKKTFKMKNQYKWSATITTYDETFGHVISEGILLGCPDICINGYKYFGTFDRSNKKHPKNRYVLDSIVESIYRFMAF